MMGETAVHKAIKFTSKKALVALISVKANLNLPEKRSGLTPLHVAINKYHVPIAYLLLQCRADPNIKDLGGNTALHHAAKMSHLKLSSVLLENGADPNLKNEVELETPLHYAVLTKDEELMKLIFSWGADIHIRNQRGMTPLNFAKLGNH